MLMKATLVALALMGMCGAALAEENPHPLRQDARIRTVAFQRDNVVVVDGALGVSTMIMFGDDEHIDTVAIGELGRMAGGSRSIEALLVHQADRARSRHQHERRNDAARL